MKKNPPSLHSFLGVPLLAVAFSSLTLLAPSTHAAVVTWDASGDATWSGPSDATSWSGATYNDGDDAQFLGAGAGTVTVSGTVNPGSIDVSTAVGVDYTLTGDAIGGTATVIKDGASRLFLDSANTYTGDTFIDGGQIRISNNDALGTTAGGTFIAGNTKLELDGGITTAEPIEIGPTSGGGGRITSISGTNTLTGPITLSSNADLRGSNYVIQGGITSTGNQGIGFNGANYIVDTNPIDLGTGTFGVTSAGNNPANATQINVAGNVWGLTIINFTGYLKIGGTDFLPTDTQVRFGFNQWNRSTGTLDLNGNDQTVRALGHFQLGLGSDNKVTGLVGDVLTINLDAASTYDTYQGRFEGGLSVVKEGAGTLILNNLSSSTAPAIVTDPSPGPVIPSTNTGTFTINDGVVESQSGIDFSDASKVVLAGGTLDLNYSGTDIVGALDLGSGFVADGIYGSVTSGAPNTDPSLTGTGTLTVDSTKLIVTWDASTDSTWTSPDPTSWSGDTYVDGQQVSFFDTGAGTVTISGTVAPGGVTVNNSAGNDYSFDGGVLGGTGSLTKSGDGNLALTGANTYSGTTTINQGRIDISNDDALGSTAGDTIVNGNGGNDDGLRIGGGITTPENITIGATAGVGSITGINVGGTTGGTFTGAITLEDGGTDFRGSALKFQGGITSAANQGLSFNGPSYEVDTNPIVLNDGAFTVTSAGNNKANALQLNVGGNDWGFMRINFGGYLLLGGANFLPADAAVQFGWSTTGNSPATLDLNGFDQTVASIAQSPNSLGNNGDVNITGGGTLTVDLATGPDEYQGRITDGATPTGLVKAGAGTLVLNNLSGTPNAYTGGTNVSAGTLSLGDGTFDTDLPDNGSVSVAGGAILDLNYTGTDTIGALDLGSGFVADGVWGSPTSGAPNTSAALTGTGTLTVDSSLLAVTWDASTDATWTNPDATSWSGNTYVDGQDATFLDTGSGTVTISGTVAPGSITVNNSAGSDYTFTGGDISGSTGITKSGGGNLTLANINTFTGNMSVDDGAIIVSGAGQLGSGNYAGEIAIIGDGLFEYGGTSDQTLAGLVSGDGTGGLVKTDTSTLDILMKPGTYTGPTTVNGGTLRFINEADLRGVGSSDFFINGAGSTLEFFSDVGAPNRTQLNNKTFTFGASGGGTLNFSSGNHLFQGGANTHNFVTTGGSTNFITSSNGGFMNLQGAGLLEFDVADGPDLIDLELSATLNNGSITKNGDGTMSLTGTINAGFGTNDITVNEGTLSVGDGTNSPNLADIGTVTVAAGATLELNYSGTDTIDQLFLGGVQVSAGVYDMSDLSGLLTGTGTLTVTTGPVTTLPEIIDVTIDGSGNVILTLDGSEAGLTVQQSDDLSPGSFVDVPSTSPGAGQLQVAAADADPDANGADYYRVRN